MEYIKLQLGCLAVVLFIAFTYLREKSLNKVDKVKYKHKHRCSLFTAMLINAIIWIIFDGLTAYTVNHLECVNNALNLVLHLCFMISASTMVFLTFLYILHITDSYPKSALKWILICLPYATSLVILFTTFYFLKFVHGKATNYSMGFSAYTCFVGSFLYFIFTFFAFFHRWKFIEHRKRMSIFVYMAVSFVVTIFQMIFPEILITAIAPTIFVLGIYLNHEDPAVKKLIEYNYDTVVDFATLVENRDNNTGGHIKRTTAYVELILHELCSRGYYKNLLTKDFINNLQMAAPMHDIGKIATPDAILQKPGKLTDEEYAVMKQHSENGAKIIQETFGKHADKDFIQTAYEVARYHHEKWNGKGYPLGLKGIEIPLAARIMAVADVFDAVSQKRCYRDALPLEQCFEIIGKGRGTDFDPDLVDIFIDIRPKVEKVYEEIYI